MKLVAIQVMAITPKGELTLKSDKINKIFNIGKVKGYLMKKVNDTYTVTEYFENPYRIIVTIKPRYNGYVNINDVLIKTKKAVKTIMNEHQANENDVSVTILEEYNVE